MNVVLRLVKSFLRAARPFVEIRRARAGLTDPSGVCLRWDHVTEMLEAVEDVHRAVLDPVLVAGDQTTSGPPVVRVLAVVVENRRATVQSLDHLLRDGTVVAEPDRTGQDQDVGVQHPLKQLGPFVARPPVLGHVRIDAGRDVVVHRPDLVDRDAFLLHQADTAVDQPLSVAHFGRPLQGAVDEQGTQTAETGGPVLRRRIGHQSSHGKSPEVHDMPRQTLFVAEESARAGAIPDRADPGVLSPARRSPSRRPRRRRDRIACSCRCAAARPAATRR